MAISSARKSSGALLASTILLVLSGTVLYQATYVGWAQLAWVLASGTAGGAIVLFLEG